MFNLFNRKNLLTYFCTFFAISNPLFAQLKPTGTLGDDLFVSNSIVKLLTPYGTGSGVVVGRIKGKNIIITARHVIEGTANGEEVEVYHSDGNIIGYVDDRDIKKSDEYDLAVLFVKNKEGKCLIPADITDASKRWLSNASTGANVLVAGLSMTDSSISKKPDLRVSRGVITNILSEDNSLNGYQMGYSSPTSRGMSGGGVFVWKRRLVFVGTHGRGERDQLRDSAKTGFNYAIPSYKSLELIQSALGSSYQFVEFGNRITITNSRHPEKTISTICKNPFGSWYCTITGNNETFVNDFTCFLTDKSGKKSRYTINAGKSLQDYLNQLN